MSKPNFLIIIADDLGFSDVSCFGSEIRTPNLDALAKEGVRFTDFHTAAACSPTRSMLLSGNDNHIAGLGAMDEQMKEPTYAHYRNQPGYEGYLNDRVAAVSEILQHDATYTTMISGKWHLGMTLPKNPHARGFDKSFVLLSGCANHYAWEPQFYDKGDNIEETKAQVKVMADFAPAMVTNDQMYTKNGAYIEVTPNKSGDPNGFYSTDAFTSQLLTFLDERQAETPSKPFFAMLTYTAPHWPLQCAEHFRAPYRGMYDDGPHALRAKRLQRMKELGLVSDASKAHPIVNGYHMAEWDAMTDEERAKSSRAMEAYAGMVECIDYNIGRVIERLKADGQLDNTVVIFMSDNGAEGASYEAAPVIGPSLKAVIDKHYNNNLDNIGNPDSFVWYGSAWAQASTAPSRLFKKFSTQGGIRVPFILRYPPFQKPEFEHTQPGTLNGAFTTVMDLPATVLDLAGVTHPAAPGQSGLFQGRKVLPMKGASWRDMFEKGKTQVHDDGIPHGWELHGNAALRMGKWKLTFVTPPWGPGVWQLHDMEQDPGEMEDLASQEPEIFKKLSEAWEHYVEENGVVWGEPMPTGTVEVDETSDVKGWMSK